MTNNIDALLSRMAKQIAEWDDDEPRDDWWRYQKDFLEAYGILTAQAAPATPEVDRCDYEISDDGVMTATIGWRRDNDATALRLLACHSVDVPDHVIALWTDEQVKEADIWAWSCALSASDHDDIQVPPRPAFLPNARSSLMRHPITGEPL